MEHAQSQPPSAVPVIDRIVAAALAAGWPTMKDAFEAAMMMTAHGVLPAEAERMFAACRRWVQ
jgi:hypothetical protein